MKDQKISRNATALKLRMVRGMKSRFHSWDSLALMGSRGRKGEPESLPTRKDLKLKVTHPLAKITQFERNRYWTLYGRSHMFKIYVSYYLFQNFMQLIAVKIKCDVLYKTYFRNKFY